MDYLRPSIYYLIPGRIESLMTKANHGGNFAFYGLYLGIRNRRNMLYITQALCLSFLIFDYRKTSFLFFILNLIQLKSYVKYLSDYGLYF